MCHPSAHILMTWLFRRASNRAACLFTQHGRKQFCREILRSFIHHQTQVRYQRGTIVVCRTGQVLSSPPPPLLPFFLFLLGDVFPLSKHEIVQTFRFWCFHHRPTERQRSSDGVQVLGFEKTIELICRGFASHITLLRTA